MNRNSVAIFMLPESAPGMTKSPQIINFKVDGERLWFFGIIWLFQLTIFYHARRAADNVTSIYFPFWIKEDYFFPTSKKKVDYFDKLDSFRHFGRHKARVSATNNALAWLVVGFKKSRLHVNQSRTVSFKISDYCTWNHVGSVQYPEIKKRGGEKAAVIYCRSNKRLYMENECGTF